MIYLILLEFIDTAQYMGLTIDFFTKNTCNSGGLMSKMKVCGQENMAYTSKK